MFYRVALVLWIVLMLSIFYQMTQQQQEEQVQTTQAKPTRMTTIPIRVTSTPIRVTSTPTKAVTTPSKAVTTPTMVTTILNRAPTEIPTFLVYFCNPYEDQERYDFEDHEEDKPVGQVYWKTLRGIDTVRSKFDMALNNPQTDSYISGTIARGHIWEPEVLGLLQTYLEGSESVFVDVGANIGYYSAMAATTKAKVYSIEAVWPNYARMAMTWQRMGKPKNWRMWRHAADMETGRTVRLQVASRGKNSGNFKVSQRVGQYWASTIALDQVVQERVDLMKLDVEGQEPQVLMGATRLVCYYGVRAIVMEFTDDVRNNTQCEWRKMFQWLNKIGYRLYQANGVTLLDWRTTRWTYRGANVLWKRLGNEVRC